MFREEELAIIRRAYAKQVLAAARVADARLEAAYAEVPREKFLGPGPWPLVGWTGHYAPTPEADPVYLYVDAVVGLLPDRFINTASPRAMRTGSRARASARATMSSMSAPAPATTPPSWRTWRAAPAR